MTHHDLLVVDDEPFNLEIIEEFLSRAPYRCTMAKDGLEAWSLLQQSPHKFRVILLDRMMPHMDGMALLKKIQTEEALRHIPIIMQTAKASTKDIMEGLSAGAHYYLTKPFDEKTLKTMVHSAITDFTVDIGKKKQMTQCFRALRNHVTSEIRFSFHTLEEGKDIAMFLSMLCPHQNRAISGFTELITNAVEHGNLGISYHEKSTLLLQNHWAQEVKARQKLAPFNEKTVTIDYRKTETYISVMVQDQGDGFDWSKYMQLDPERAFDTHGRGIAIANMMSFDRLLYHDNGRSAEAIIRL